jgi:hypothetical protein
MNARTLNIALCAALLIAASESPARSAGGIQNLNCSGTVACTQQGATANIVGSGAPGPQGPAGPAGAVGPVGPQGIAGTVANGILPPGVCAVGDSRYEIDGANTQFRIYFCGPTGNAVRSMWFPLDHSGGY